MDKCVLEDVSLVVCARNEGKNIADKIENLLAVDKNNPIREIIIVDDNSTDKTSEISTSYAKKNGKVITVKNIYKRGKWGAIVTGFGMAQGEVVCITDADVLFEEETLERALRLFDNPLVGGVTGNQKNVLLSNGIKKRASVNFYERCMNFFRSLTSKIDSTISFHGQCMLIRKKSLELPEDGIMADDVYIAINLRKNGYRVLFCENAYYIEEMTPVYSKNSKMIFRRRARAIAEAMIKNVNLLFNPKYKNFGFICFPLYFFLYIVFPFLVVITSVSIALLLAYHKYMLLLTIFILLLIGGRNLLMMAWFQMVSTIEYMLSPT
ncbi:glycosyltransferase [Candidatus Omnitrophota bacterium]